MNHDIKKSDKIFEGFFFNDKICCVFEKFLLFNQNDKIYSITYYLFRFDDRYLIILKKTVQTFKRELKSNERNNYLKKLIFE